MYISEFVCGIAATVFYGDHPCDYCISDLFHEKGQEAMQGQRCSFREGVAFTVFLLSAGAMDSESRVLPVIIFLGAASVLCWMGLADRERGEMIMGANCFDCSTCIHRYLHFPNMDDFEISMQECLCDGEDYEEEY